MRKFHFILLVISGILILSTLSFAMIMESPDHPSPVVSDSKIYVMKTRRIYALDKLTGLILWNQKVDSESFVPYKEFLIGISDFGHIIAVDKKTGEKKWDSYFPGSDGPGLTGFSYVQIAGDTLFVVSCGEIIAFDLINKKISWRYNKSRIEGKLIFVDNAIYAGAVQDNNTCLIILDLNTGEILNNIELEPKGLNPGGTPWVTKDKIAVCSNRVVSQNDSESIRGRIFVFDRKTGDLIFKSEEMGDITGEIIGENNLIFFMSIEGASFLRKKGSAISYCNAYDISSNNLRWKTKIGDGGVSSKIKKYGAFIVSEADDDEGGIYLLQISDGSPVWKFETGQRVGSDFVLDGDTLYFTTTHPPNFQDSGLYAIDLKQNKLIWKNLLEAQEKK